MERKEGGVGKISCVNEINRWGGGSEMNGGKERDYEKHQECEERTGGNFEKRALERKEEEHLHGKVRHLLHFI